MIGQPQPNGELHKISLRIKLCAKGNTTYDSSQILGAVVEIEEDPVVVIIDDRLGISAV